ncbi:MAG: RidA family protein [Bacillota bacterium]|nr:RidA family protein [Bacillota bacterium]
MSECKIEAKAKEIGLTVREFTNPNLPFTSAVQTGNVLFVSGHTPTIDGVAQYHGVTGTDVNLETAQKAAMLCLENCLGAVKTALGSLDRVSKIVKVNGFVASAPGFDKQALVMNPASEALISLFGQKHARAALGVAMLPGNVPVEVELVVEVKD